MDKIKLKTKFDFDSAHRLVGYDGLCSDIHGHMWKVELEIEGNKLDNVGILWDFSNRKKIKEIFDHKTILKDCKENDLLIDVIRDTCGHLSVYTMKENPTAENLCKEILSILKSQNKKLKYKVRVFESPKSSCEVEG